MENNKKQEFLKYLEGLKETLGKLFISDGFLGYVYQDMNPREVKGMLVPHVSQIQEILESLGPNADKLKEEFDNVSRWKDETAYIPDILNSLQEIHPILHQILDWEDLSIKRTDETILTFTSKEKQILHEHLLEVIKTDSIVSSGLTDEYGILWLIKNFRKTDLIIL